jgi:hypothetical protein
MEAAAARAQELLGKEIMAGRILYGTRLYRDMVVPAAAAQML